MSHIPKIAVIGAGNAAENILEIAHSVGSAIAEQSYHLVCGGKAGVMEAACRGFRFARNELNTNRVVAIGVLPEETADFVNEFVDIAIPTGMGVARNVLITRMADGIIAVGGGSGTLSEIALGWQLGKPIAALAHSGGWSEQLAGTSIDDSLRDPVYAAENAADAMRFIRGKLSAGLQ
ncbi:MAG: TIGR00725 family protein [Deltaproteobacteria bacterium]|nr:TIGR00725 family protein [Deltaproteobacteria bacterium]MBN2670889.1 TIGR00725 family protein [Deltaproteobacteria bacterium]